MNVLSSEGRSNPLGFTGLRTVPLRDGVRLFGRLCTAMALASAVWGKIISCQPKKNTSGHTCWARRVRGRSHASGIRDSSLKWGESQFFCVSIGATVSNCALPFSREGKYIDRLDKEAAGAVYHPRLQQVRAVNTTKRNHPQRQGIFQQPLERPMARDVDGRELDICTSGRPCRVDISHKFGELNDLDQMTWVSMLSAYSTHKQIKQATYLTDSPGYLLAASCHMFAGHTSTGELPLSGTSLTYLQAKHVNSPGEDEKKTRCLPYNRQELISIAQLVNELIKCDIRHHPGNIRFDLGTRSRQLIRAFLTTAPE